MKILEVIHLRMAGNDPERLAAVVLAVVGEAGESPTVRIYRHARVEGDLLVHLHHEGAGQRDQFSELGLRLSSVLRSHGLIEHSVWIQANV